MDCSIQQRQKTSNGRGRAASNESPTGKIGISKHPKKETGAISNLGEEHVRADLSPHWVFPVVPPPFTFRAYLLPPKPSIIMYKLAIASLLATSAAAFAPAQSAGRASTSLNLNGWVADEVRDIKSSEMKL